MKIEFTAYRELDAITRKVFSGDTLESSDTVSEDLLRSYVSNGIAVEVQQKPTPKASKIIEGGE